MLSVCECNIVHDMENYNLNTMHSIINKNTIYTIAEIYKIIEFTINNRLQRT